MVLHRCSTMIVCTYHGNWFIALLFWNSEPYRHWNLVDFRLLQSLSNTIAAIALHGLFGKPRSPNACTKSNFTQTSPTYVMSKVLKSTSEYYLCIHLLELASSSVRPFVTKFQLLLLLLLVTKNRDWPYLCNEKSWCQNNRVFLDFSYFCVGHTAWAPKECNGRSQAGPNSRHQKVGAWRAPRLLVITTFCPFSNLENLI